MTKICPICDIAFQNEDSVVAMMVAKFILIESDVNFALDHPTKCLELVHEECFDYEDYGDEDE